jgi:hypothetical protein
MRSTLPNKRLQLALQPHVKMPLFDGLVSWLQLARSWSVLRSFDTHVPHGAAETQSRYAASAIIEEMRRQ